MLLKPLLTYAAAIASTVSARPIIKPPSNRAVINSPSTFWKPSRPNTGGAYSSVNFEEKTVQ